MIGNKDVPSIILPCLNHTDVKIRVNLIYNMNVGVEVGPVPMDILRMLLLMVPPMMSLIIESESLLFMSHHTSFSPIFLIHLHIPHRIF